MSDSNVLSTRAIFIGNKLKPAEKNSDPLFVCMRDQILKNGKLAVNLHRILHDTGVAQKTHTFYQVIFETMPFFIHLILLCFHVEKVLPFYLYFCFLVAEQPAPPFTYKRQCFYFQGMCDMEPSGTDLGEIFK